MLGEQIISEANKALVERFVIQWLNKRDGEAFRQICTDDYVAHWRALGDGHGHDEVERMEKLALAAFPDPPGEHRVDDQRRRSRRPALAGHRHS